MASMLKAKRRVAESRDKLFLFYNTIHITCFGSCQHVYNYAGICQRAGEQPRMPKSVRHRESESVREKEWKREGAGNERSDSREKVMLAPSSCSTFKVHLFFVGRTFLLSWKCKSEHHRFNCY